MAGAWITALDPVSSGSTLPSPLRANPLRIFESTSATLDMATQCLATYVSSLHQKSANRRDARTVYAADQPGTKALRWYTARGAHERSDALMQPKFSKLMTHCILAEDREHTVWELLDLEYQPASICSSNIHWRSHIFSGLVCARKFWSHGSRAFARGVSAWCRGLAMSKTSRTEQSTSFLSAHNAARPLQGFAVRVKPRHLDARSFDRFSASLTRFTGADPSGIRTLLCQGTSS